MKRLILLIAIFVATGAVYVTLMRTPSDIALVGAKAHASQDSTMVMVGLTIENAGEPDVLLGASSPNAHMISILNPGHDDRAMVVPGNGSAILAMDGAHVMMHMHDDFEEGAFAPLTLTFAKAGKVSTRVQHVGMSMMSHDASMGVTTDPAAILSILLEGEPSKMGLSGTVRVENFSFVRVEDGTAHVAGEGHAHLYLNGVKLSRLYDPTFEIGALPAGDYVLEIGLNSHDHRPYLDASGAPIHQTLSFTVP